MKRSAIYTVLPFAFFPMLAACGGAQTVCEPPPNDYQAEAQAFLDFYGPTMRALYAESAEAAWLSSTDVNDEHTGMRIASDKAVSAFTGSALVIERTRALLEHESELEPATARQLRVALRGAAGAPQTNPELAAARIEAEARQAAKLDAFEFCLQRENGVCTSVVSTNDLDEILITSNDLTERLRAWNAAKEVGFELHDGLEQLRDLRNGVAQEMGYPDYFSYMVEDYGMTREEMMAQLDQLVEEMSPLYSRLHCWTRYELAERYNAETPAGAIPAHWIGNRWGQSWPGLAPGVDMDALVADKSPEWIVQTAESFYTSMGFAPLPQNFWDDSDLYPVPEGETRQKNDHASAWHMDLDHEVRSLMSVEPNWDWFSTTHHELGHIYYFLAYSRPEVPWLLRDGANRSFHEGIGDLISLASSQTPYLEELGLLQGAPETSDLNRLLDSALTGPVVFLPFAAGTMAHFEHDLYAENLPAAEFNERWWKYVGEFQGIVPPEVRAEGACDACTKTHIIDDPAGYYDYALANVFLYQLHGHICTEILGQDPRNCNYYGSTEVGDFLRKFLEAGATRDWRDLLRDTVGADLSAQPMLDYYAPLLSWLDEQNAGRECSF